MFPFSGSAPAGVWPVGAALGIGLAAGLLAALLRPPFIGSRTCSTACPSTGCGGRRSADRWWGWAACWTFRFRGAGYASIQSLLDGAIAMREVAILLVLKAIVWLVALGSGTSGGVLGAPPDLGRRGGLSNRQPPAGRRRPLVDDRHGRRHERGDARAHDGRIVRS